jgi:hypothetical protein
MAKRLILPGFTIVLAIIIFIVFYAFSDGASSTLASYPPLSYPDPAVGPTGTAASGSWAGSTPSPMLFVPGMHKSAVGEPQKGLAWKLFLGPTVTDAVPFNISWYHNWSLFPPNRNPNYHWPATVGAEHIPFLSCLTGNMDPNNPASYPDHLSKDYTGYMLFTNEPEREDQCGGALTSTNKVISATEVYADVVALFPNAKLIGPNFAYEAYGPAGGEITSFLEAWRTRVITMGLPLPHGYGIHLYPSPTNLPADEWTQAYCDKLYEWGELDKELWVTEYGWSNDWVLGETDEERQEFMYTRVADEFGFLRTGLDGGTPTPGAEPSCQITRYAWYTTRVKPFIDPTPTPNLTATPTPTPGVGYTDLYWYYMLTRSYTGNAYVDFGNLATPTPTP